MMPFGKKKVEIDSTLLANIILLSGYAESIANEVHELKVISEDILSLVRKNVEVNTILTATLDKFLIIQNRIALEEAKRRAAKEDELGMTRDDLRF